MFLRSFSRRDAAYNPKVSLIFTLALGVVIFGFFYFFNRVNQNRYPYHQLKENRVFYIEREQNGNKDTVTWLCRRVNIWRYYGTNLGLYSENSDNLLAEFQTGRDYLSAVFSTIPFYDLFDHSGQQYGISLLPAGITDSSRWNDDHLGMQHFISGRDTLQLLGRKIASLRIETRLSLQAIKMIRQKLTNRNDPAINSFEKICRQSWINWYSREYGWLQSVYPDGRRQSVVEIRDIYWFERISRFFDFGIKSGTLNFTPSDRSDK